MTQNEKIAEKYSQKLVEELLTVPHPQGKAYRIILDAITEALSLKGEEVYSRNDMIMAFTAGCEFITDNKPNCTAWLRNFKQSKGK